jgi:hypothetical protein
MKKKSEFLSALGIMFEIVKALIQTLLDNGGTDDDLRRIQADKGLRKEIVNLILSRRPSRLWKPWKTITHKAGKQTAESFRSVLAQAGCRIGDWANKLLNRVGFSEYASETTVDLIVVSNAELGLNVGATFRETCERGLKMGLGLCLPEDGPELRRQYLDQPMGERLVMAMEAFGVGAVLDVWSVVRSDGGLWLSGADGDPDYHRGAATRFVFRSRK